MCDEVDYKLIVDTVANSGNSDSFNATSVIMVLLVLVAFGYLIHLITKVLSTDEDLDNFRRSDSVHS